MSIKRITDLYGTIKKRLPSTYPRPKLAFYEDEECLLDNTSEKKAEDEVVYAVVTPETCTINLPLSLIFEYETKNKKTYHKKVSLSKFSDRKIVLILVHEIAHLYAGERYGYESDQYSNESYCDRFAERWYKILIKENLLPS